MVMPENDSDVLDGLLSTCGHRNLLNAHFCDVCGVKLPRNVLVAPRSIVARQTSAGTAGCVCPTYQERTLHHQSDHSDSPRTVRLRPSRSQPWPPQDSC